jgi:hypothetical protein
MAGKCPFFKTTGVSPSHRRGGSTQGEISVYFTGELWLFLAALPRSRLSARSVFGASGVGRREGLLRRASQERLNLGFHFFSREPLSFPPPLLHASMLTLGQVCRSNVFW